MSQLAFEFDAPPAPQPPARRRAAAGAAAPTLEEMARRLEADPDYRVLRRLVPVMDYGPRPEASAGACAGTRNLLILDTETTGLVQASDRIIELAMLRVQVDVATGQPFGPVETFEGFEDPGMPIPAIAREVTGITDEMVRGHRLDDGRVETMVAAADLVVAHNAGFDRPFVEARFPGFALKPWACSLADIDWKALGAESSRLGALAQDRGWFYDAHRALVDCHALLQVLNCPLGGGEGTGLGRLINASQQPRFKLRATGSPFESKDLLKARGYRWDGEGKVWWRSLDGEGPLEAEIAWLKDEVYGSRRSAQVHVEVLDALTRFSARPGQVEIRGLSDV